MNRRDAVGVGSALVIVPPQAVPVWLSNWTGRLHTMRGVVLSRSSCFGRMLLLPPWRLGVERVRLRCQDEIVAVQAPDRVGPPRHRHLAPLRQQRRVVPLGLSELAPASVNCSASANVSNANTRSNCWTPARSGANCEPAPTAAPTAALQQQRGHGASCRPQRSADRAGLLPWPEGRGASPARCRGVGRATSGHATSGHAQL
jgi:hypothetical protein